MRSVLSASGTSSPCQSPITSGKLDQRRIQANRPRSAPHPQTPPALDSRGRRPAAARRPQPRPPRGVSTALVVPVVMNVHARGRESRRTETTSAPDRADDPQPGHLRRRWLRRTADWPCLATYSNRVATTRCPAAPAVRPVFAKRTHRPASHPPRPAAEPPRPPGARLQPLQLVQRTVKGPLHAVSYRDSLPKHCGPSASLRNAYPKSRPYPNGNAALGGQTSFRLRSRSATSILAARCSRQAIPITRSASSSSSSPTGFNCCRRPSRNASSRSASSSASSMVSAVSPCRSAVHRRG